MDEKYNVQSQSPPSPGLSRFLVKFGGFPLVMTVREVDRIRVPFHAHLTAPRIGRVQAALVCTSDGRVFKHRDGNVVILPGTDWVGMYRRSTGEVRSDTGRVDEIGEIAGAGEVFRLPDVVVDQVNQFTKDGEFELQLDAVYGTLEHGLHDIIITVLGDE